MLFVSMRYLFVACVFCLGDDIEHWVSCSLSQTVLLSLEMRWTGELYSALISDNPLQQLRHIRSEHISKKKKIGRNFFSAVVLCMYM